LRSKGDPQKESEIRRPGVFSVVLILTTRALLFPPDSAKDDGVRPVSPGDKAEAVCIPALRALTKTSEFYEDTIKAGSCMPKGHDECFLAFVFVLHISNPPLCA